MEGERERGRERERERERYESKVEKLNHFLSRVIISEARCPYQFPSDAVKTLLFHPPLLALSLLPPLTERRVWPDPGVRQLHWRWSPLQRRGKGQHRRHRSEPPPSLSAASAEPPGLLPAYPEVHFQT